MHYEFRSGFGRFLAAAVIATAVLGLVLVAWNDGLPAAGRALPPLALACGVVWALFWRPCVVVDETAVTLHNVLSTVTVPWGTIQRIDTKWALSLTTAGGTYTAWAAPAPGRHGTQRFNLREGRHLPESTYAADRSIRPGDTPGSMSGSAALVIRRHWEKLRDTGYLDDPRHDADRPTVAWHWFTMSGGLALVVAVLLVV